MTLFHFIFCVFISSCLKLVLLRSVRGIEWQDILDVDWQIIRKESFLKCCNLKMETTEPCYDR
jgi:hypothetical protein